MPCRHRDLAQLIKMLAAEHSCFLHGFIGISCSSGRMFHMHNGAFARILEPKCLYLYTRWLMRKSHTTLQLWANHWAVPIRC